MAEIEAFSKQFIDAYYPRVSAAFNFVEGAEAQGLAAAHGMDVNAVVAHYENLRNSGREQLIGLYADDVSLTRPEGGCQGKNNVLSYFAGTKLKINYESVAVNHQVSGDRLLMFVAGDLKVNGAAHGRFSQCFVLKQFSGNWLIINDIFRPFTYSNEFKNFA